MSINKTWVYESKTIRYNNVSWFDLDEVYKDYTRIGAKLNITSVITQNNDDGTQTITVNFLHPYKGDEDL